jgi:hypothetical protein
MSEVASAVRLGVDGFNSFSTVADWTSERQLTTEP